MFQGKMTYAGIAIFALAFVLKDFATTEEIQTTVDSIIKVVSDVAVIVGTLTAWYGRYRISRARY